MVGVIMIAGIALFGFLFYWGIQAIVAKVNSSAPKDAAGNVVHQHVYEYVGTKTVSYGAGFNKKTYQLYRCRLCGKEMVKDHKI